MRPRRGETHSPKGVCPPLFLDKSLISRVSKNTWCSPSPDDEGGRAPHPFFLPFEHFPALMAVASVSSTTMGNRRRGRVGGEGNESSAIGDDERVDSGREGRGVLEPPSGRPSERPVATKKQCRLRTTTKSLVHTPIGSQLE